MTNHNAHYINHKIYCCSCVHVPELRGEGEVSFSFSVTCAGCGTNSRTDIFKPCELSLKGSEIMLLQDAIRKAVQHYRDILPYQDLRISELYDLSQHLDNVFISSFGKTEND
jgi:hypothetical protein